MGFFFRLLMLAFGGAAIWGATTEEGRSFFGDLLAGIGNWLSRQFPGLNGMMGFLNPSQDPEGVEREQFLRNGNMTLLQQGMQRYGEVPEEIVTAIAGDRATFNEFLTELGPETVRAVSRTPNAATVTAAITPDSIARVMGNPRLSPRILAAAERLTASGTAPAAGSAAAAMSDRIREQATRLLLDPQHRPALEEALRRNPQLLEQVRPLMRRAAGPEATPFMEALTQSPQTLSAFLDATRESGITPESLQAEGGIQNALTPRTLSAMLSRPAVAGPLLGAAAQAMQSTGGAASPLTLRVQQAASDLLIQPSQQENLRRIFAGNPTIISQLLPVAATAARQGGATAGAGMDLATILGNPVIAEQLRSPQQQQVLLRGLQEHAQTLQIPPTALAMLQEGNGQNLTTLSTLLANPALRDANGQLNADARALLTVIPQLGAEATRPAATEQLTQIGLRLATHPQGERLISEIARLQLPNTPEMAPARNALAMLSPQNASLLATLGRDPQSMAFLQAATPLLTSLSSDAPNVGALAGVLTTYPAQTAQLLQGLDVHSLPANQREGFTALRDFALAPSSDNRTNLVVLTEAVGALRRPDGTLPDEAQQAVRAAMALRKPDLSSEERERHTTALTRAGLGLITQPGGTRAIEALRMLSLGSAAPAAATSALAALTPENVALAQRVAPHLLAADDATLGAAMTTLTQFSRGELRIDSLLETVRQPGMVATLGRVMTNLPADVLPGIVSDGNRATYATAREVLLAPATTPAGTPAQTNLQVLGAILNEPALQTPAGQTFATHLRAALGDYVDAPADQRALRPESTAALVQSTLALAQQPNAGPLLERIGQLNLQGALGDNARALQFLSPQNIPLLQRALAGLDEGQRASLTTLATSYLTRGELEITDLRALTLVQNPDVQRLIQGMQTTGLPERAASAVTAWREQLCAPAPAPTGNWLTDLRNSFTHSALRATDASVCTPGESAAPLISGAPTSQPTTVSGGVDVREGTRVAAAPTPPLPTDLKTQHVATTPPPR
jgi:hypothetical protein